MRKEDYEGTKIGIESKIQVKIQKSKIRNHFVFCNATSSEFLAKQGVMLSFDENGPRKFERKKRASMSPFLLATARH